MIMPNTGVFCAKHEKESIAKDEAMALSVLNRDTTFYVIKSMGAYYVENTVPLIRINEEQLYQFTNGKNETI